ncbi:aspartic peptidase domain-containing protein [Suillus lakei]|nr:aspartic peptidase domain-containing protein [Suillus lakei]
MSRVVIDSIPFTTYLHAAGHSNKGLLQRERARAQKFLAGKFHYVRSSIVEGLHGHHHKCTATAPSSTVPSGTEENITVGDPIDATDTGVIYTMSVGVGEPAVEYTLAIDTGSGHTWVGGNLEKPYKPSECSHDTGHAITTPELRSLSMVRGVWFGEEYNDTLTLGPKLVIKNQGIGVAESTKGFKYFKDIDGVLGLGPVDLTQGDVVDTWEVPTVTDNLYSQHQIPRIIGVFYQPSSTANVSNGEITFGAPAISNFVQLTTVSPASQYWGINQSVSYGTDNIKLGVAPALSTLVVPGFSLPLRLSKYMRRKLVVFTTSELSSMNH